MCAENAIPKQHGGISLANFDIEPSHELKDYALQIKSEQVLQTLSKDKNDVASNVFNVSQL